MEICLLPWHFCCCTTKVLSERMCQLACKSKRRNFKRKLKIVNIAWLIDRYLDRQFKSFYKLCSFLIYLVIQFIYFSNIKNIVNATSKFKNTSFQMRTSVYNEHISCSTDSNATNTKYMGTVVTKCQLCLYLKM